MIGLKRGLCPQPHHVQHRADRTFARGQQDTDQQRLRLRPDTGQKKGLIYLSDQAGASY